MNGREISLPPVIPQVLGILIVVGAVAFWAITNRASPMIFGAGVSLYTLGKVQGYRVTLQKRKTGTDDD